MFFMYYINNLNRESLIQNERNEALKVLQTNFDITINYNAIDANAMNYLFKSDPKIIDIISKATIANEQQRVKLRKILYNHLFKKYKSMKMKGVLQFQFTLPDNTVFLRMHRVDEFGDNLSQVRYTLVYTNKTHKASSGFEQGKTTHSFRNVFPLFDVNKKYIGCYEISFSSKLMQNNLTNVNKIYSHFLIKKNIYNTKKWSKSYLYLDYKQSIENNSYIFTSTHHKDKITIDNLAEYIIKPNKKLIKKNMNDQKKFAFFSVYKHKALILAFLPIQSIKNKSTSAYIVSYTDSQHIINILLRYQLINFLSFIIFSIILFLLYRIITTKDYLEEEVKKQTNELIQKDKIMQEQSKLAAMGEMVGAIAHQWRQPLNSLNINIQNLDDDYVDGLIDAEFLDSFIIKQTKTMNFMSKTIDDFRNFFRIDKIKKTFSVKEAIFTTISIQSAQLNNLNISIKVLGEDFKLTTIESEFLQVILNLITNAKDALIENKTSNGKIFISLQQNIITVSDNAGGIDKKVINRIFEPYFTTKEQGKGTGMGLYMSKMIIEQTVGGTLSVANNKKGAEFKIVFNSLV